MLKNFVDVDPGALTPEQLDRAMQMEFIKFLMGMIAGIVVIFAGIAAIFMGYVGSINWVVTGAGWSSKLENATPGAFLVVAGGIIIS